MREGAIGERLSGVDAAWYRIDRPENTADVLGLLEFRRVPRLDELRRLLGERLLAYPRFRQRVETASDGVRWEDAPGFDLDRHLVQLQISSARDLRGVVSSVASERLDPDRPLWRFHLVDGPEGGALIAKIHHCIADGFALVSLLLALADEQPVHAHHRHRLPASRLLDPWNDPDAPRGALRAVEMAKRAGAFTAALARMTALPADPSTLLRRSPAGRRRVAWSRGLSLESVRRAARARRATVNDLLMAALGGAIRAWLTAAGELADADVRALVPVNLRPWAPGAGDVSLGNRFGLVFVSLPVATATAAGRIEAIQTRMAAAKERPDAAVAFKILAALGHLPALEPLITRFFTRKASLVVTNVPGPGRPVHLAGCPVEHAMFWVPHPVTLGVGASILSYAGEVRVGIRSDVAVMAEPADLVAAFEEEAAALGASPREGNHPGRSRE